MDERTRLYEAIDGLIPEIVSLQKALTAVPALAPESGGDGETAKAEVLQAWLTRQGFTQIQRFDAPDDRVPSKKRPNIVVTVPGRSPGPAFWVMTHLDVVPPGEISYWKGDPYTVREEDGKLFGRGVEDNQQGLCSSVAAALALLRVGHVPKHPARLLFCADEEVGSRMGIQYLLDRHEKSLFGKGDLFLVPDGGEPDGTTIEVAEKSILWLKFTVRGKQVHASTPQHGVNAFLAGSDLVVRLAKQLPRAFGGEDPIFDPPYSTFAPTKKEANVPNVNTIPGLDVFCLDCRVLPKVDLADVEARIDIEKAAVEKEYGVGVSYERLQSVSSPATPTDSPLVEAVSRAVKQVYGVDARPVGVGGGTVGAYLRKRGYHTVIWSRIDHTAHMPNEYSVVANMMGDAKVMVELMADLDRPRQASI